MNSMNGMPQKQKGFTIVELLVVIVVIGILAAITIVAFNGVQDRANVAALDSKANQIGKKVRLYHAENGSYPATLTEAGVNSESGISYSYMTAGEYFCAAIQKTGTLLASGSGSSGKCGGLNAKYYNNTTRSDPVALERFDKDLNNTWGTASPGSGVGADNFSVKWEGYLTAPITDTYTFTLISDDRSQLFLNNALVYDETSCCTDRTFTYALIAGQRIPIRWELTELGGGAQARLRWSYTGQTTVPIPSSAFSL
jgi:prepilin-type N-terminal cleavage/methylation domain-containing protein